MRISLNFLDAWFDAEEFAVRFRTNHTGFRPQKENQPTKGSTGQSDPKKSPAAMHESEFHCHLRGHELLALL